MESKTDRGAISYQSEQRLGHSIGEKLVSQMSLREHFAALAITSFGVELTKKPEKYAGHGRAYRYMRTKMVPSGDPCLITKRRKRFG